MSVDAIASRFYEDHPACKERAEKDPAFDIYVKANAANIQMVFFLQVEEMVSSLKSPERKADGARTLQGPVFVVIHIPTPDQFHTTLASDLGTPAIATDEEYMRRVDELSDKISGSLDRILSRYTIDKLNRHVALANQGLSINIFSQPFAKGAANRFFKLPPESVKPDGVGIHVVQ